MSRGHKVVVASTSSGMHGERLVTDNDWRFPVVRFQSVSIPAVPYSYTPFAGNALINLAREFQPDIIHTHFLMYWLSLNSYQLTKYGWPLILTLHGFTLPNEPLSWPSGIALKFLYYTMGANLVNSASHVLGVSEHIITKFKSAYPNLACPTNLMPIGVNTRFLERTLTRSREDIRSELGFDDKRVFVYLGRVVREKGMSELAIAFRELKKRNQNVGLLVIGDGNFDPIMRKLLRNVSDVQMVGFKENIGTYLNASDVFVLPSYREGLPTALLEAMYFKLPFISTGVGGISDVRKMGAQGSIVPVENTLKLYQEMERFGNLNSSILQDM
ncbi:MAG: glycosyltransferase, partial [Candidatus Thorarchaeota archaeon]